MKHCILAKFTPEAKAQRAALLPRIREIFSAAADIPGVTFETLYYLKSYAVILAIAVVGSTPLPKKLISMAKKNKYGKYIVNALEPLVCIVLLAVCTAFLIDGSFNPFLYFRF